MFLIVIMSSLFVQVVSPDELKEENEYEEILEDMREECGRYGKLINLVIPRPNPTGEEVPGIGMVFVEYGDLQGAAKAKASLHGRKFGGNTVIATYYAEEKFMHGDYGG
jgi:splicing factor U2AF subunit